jgi:hypothetical protein
MSVPGAFAQDSDTDSDNLSAAAMAELEELARLDTDSDDEDFDPEGILGDSDDYHMDDDDEEEEVVEEEADQAARGAAAGGGTGGGDGTLRIGIDRTLPSPPYSFRRYSQPCSTQLEPATSTSSTPAATLVDSPPPTFTGAISP